jgi:membrane protein implicated in regulation of membrane protease activity
MNRLNKKVFSYLSIGTLVAGALVGGYALVKIWVVRAAGACPVDTNRPLLYLGIALCAVSFVLTLLETRAAKAEARNKPESGSGGKEA